MRMALLFLCVVVFMFANTTSVVLFKVAAQSPGKKWIWYFLLGNGIGVLGPAAMTLALRESNPNLVYALCFCGAFALFQIVSWRLFQQPLSPVQWAGIACVGVGILLLQLR